MRKKLAVTPERCSGCRTCEIACSMKHFKVINPKKSAIRVMVLYPNPIIRMPIVCSQCTIPKCAEVCPKGAIKKDENGIISINEADCVGCQMCVEACPFGAIYSHEGVDVPFKCDLCGGDPECVKACANGALHFVPAHIFAEKLSQMLLMENDDLIQELAPKTSEKPLAEGILPWRSVSTLDLLDPGILQKLPHLLSVEPIIVPMQVTRNLPKRCRLA